MRPPKTLKDPIYKDDGTEELPDVSFSYELLDSLKSFDHRKFSVRRILISLKKALSECMYNALLFPEKFPPLYEYIKPLPPLESHPESKIKYIDAEFKKLPYEARPDRTKKVRDEPQSIRHKIDKINEKRALEWNIEVNNIGKKIREKVFYPLHAEKVNLFYEPLIHKLTGSIRDHEKVFGPSKIEYPSFVYDDLLEMMCNICNSRLRGETPDIPVAFEKRLDDLTNSYVPIRALVKDFGIIADVWEWE